MVYIKGYRVMMAVFLAMLAITLFVAADYTFFTLIYILVFLLMTARTLVVPTARRVKFYLITVYGAILMVQLAFNTLLTFGNHNTVLTLVVCRAFGIAVIVFPSLIERFVMINKYAKFYFPSASEVASISFSTLKENLDLVLGAVTTVHKAGKSLSPDNLKEIAEDLPRHRSFSYISRGSLTREYFKAANESLKDPYLYIVVSNTGSPASEIISVFTQKPYNHASLSFDRDLATIISYNGGERIYAPGLNHEMLEFFNKKEDASIIVYRLPCSREQKKKIIDKVEEINREGSAYNMMGLVLKYSHKPNIMFCSQFVYKMLEYAGLNYFTKGSTEVRPTDLVELDYYRKLEFVYEIFLNNKENQYLPAQRAAEGNEETNT